MGRVGELCIPTGIWAAALRNMLAILGGALWGGYFSGKALSGFATYGGCARRLLWASSNLGQAGVEAFLLMAQGLSGIKRLLLRLMTVVILR